jgi:hypothetical protein
MVFAKMNSFFRDFVPSLPQVVGLCSVLLSAVVFVLIGRLARCHKGLEDTALLCGWGIVIFAYTAFATLSVINLKFVVWATLLAGVFAVIYLRSKGQSLAPSSGWRVFVFGFPFLVIASAKWPSEVDVLSHWLYNAQYLLDNGSLPRPGFPLPLSAYTGFPYNHTFILHFVSTIGGQFADSAANVVNFGLVILFAVLLARLIQLARIGTVIDSWPPVGWSLAALAVILATYANPIFVRKIVLMANPDTATSVGLAFLGIVGWQLMERLREGAEKITPWALQFSFLALLFVNMKQPNLVILIFLFASMVGCGVFYSAQSWRRLAVWTPLLLGPAVISYLLWRYFLSTTLALHEATLLPFAEWQFENIPAILSSMYANVVKKAGHFGIMFVLTGWAVWRLWRPKSGFDRLAILVAGVFLSWNAFLFFLYFAHWTGHASTGASSYWRYNTFIGYLGYAVAVYGVARLIYQDKFRPLLDLLARYRLTFSQQRLGQLVVLIAIVMPFVTAPYLRFDREEPKLFLRKIGIELSGSLPKGTRLLVHIPGDVGDYATIMQYFTNRFRMDISVAPAPIVRTIKKDVLIPRSSVPMVWSLCRHDGLETYHGIKLPNDRAFLLERLKGVWRIRQSWPHPKPGVFSRYHKNFKRTRCKFNF